MWSIKKLKKMFPVLPAILREELCPGFFWNIIPQPTYPALQEPEPQVLHPALLRRVLQDENKRCLLKMCSKHQVYSSLTKNPIMFQSNTGPRVLNPMDSTFVYNGKFGRKTRVGKLLGERDWSILALIKQLVRGCYSKI